MGAPKGNQFWKLRSKHGRDKIFDDPKILKTEAEKYFEETAQRTWNKEDFIKAGPNAGKKIELETSAPFLMKGLCVFLGVNIQYFRDFKEGLKGMEDRKKAEDFSLIVSYIEDIVSIQKLEGGLTGAYNSLMVSQIEELKTRTDITSGDKEIKGVTLSKDEMKDLSKELEDDM